MGLEDRDYMRERLRRRQGYNDEPKFSAKIRGWIVWSVVTIPIIILSQGAAMAWGWTPVIIIMLIMLLVALIVARFVQGRSWRSIMWGDPE